MRICKPSETHWLIGCRNVWALIEPAEDGKSFADGVFDDVKVVVLSVSDTSVHGDWFGSTANCRMMDGREEGGNRAIPLKHLGPIRPDVGDSALVLHSRMKGQIVKVKRASGDAAWVVQETIPGKAADELMVEMQHMVKYQYF